MSQSKNTGKSTSASGGEADKKADRFVPVGTPSQAIGANLSPNSAQPSKKRNRKNHNAQKGGHLSSSGVSSSSSSSPSPNSGVFVGDSLQGLDAPESLSAAYASSVDDTSGVRLAVGRSGDVGGRLGASVASEEAEEPLTGSFGSSSPFFGDDHLRGEARGEEEALLAHKADEMYAAMVESSGEDGWDEDEEVDLRRDESHPILHAPANVQVVAGRRGDLSARKSQQTTVSQGDAPPIERWSQSHGVAKASASRGGDAKKSGDGLPAVESPQFDATLEQQLSHLDARSSFAAQHAYMSPNGKGAQTGGQAKEGGGGEATRREMSPATHLLPANDERRYGSDGEEGGDEETRVQHCMHALLCVLCCGLWTPCWIGACSGVCCQRPFETASRMCNCCCPSETPIANGATPQSTPRSRSSGKKGQFETVF